MTTNGLYEISDEELSAVTNAIKNRYGIDFTSYEKKSLKRGFGRLMGKKGLASLLDLWKLILSDHNFLKSSIDDLTVNLTELFRNPEIWEAIDQDLLEKMKHKRVINMWHAGCSTGEEVYSMAMVLHKKNLLYRSKTLATDISTAVLEKAVEGAYSKTLAGKYEKSFQRYLPTGLMSDMFDVDGKNAVVKDKFRRHIEFKKHNLVSDGMTSKFDIIFCRNVMIYFDDNLKLKVLELLKNALNPDGFLILGYYDMLPEKSKSIIDQYDPKIRVYKPKPNDQPGSRADYKPYGFTIAK